DLIVTAVQTCALPIYVRLELRVLEQRVRLGVVEREPLELDQEEEALEVGGPVAGERREVVRLGVHRVGVLAGRGVEVDRGDVLRSEERRVREGGGGWG